MSNYGFDTPIGTPDAAPLLSMGAKLNKTDQSNSISMDWGGVDSRESEITEPDLRPQPSTRIQLERKVRPRKKLEPKIEPHVVGITRPLPEAARFTNQMTTILLIAFIGVGVAAGDAIVDALKRAETIISEQFSPKKVRVPAGVKKKRAPYRVVPKNRNLTRT